MVQPSSYSSHCRRSRAAALVLGCFVATLARAGGAPLEPRLAVAWNDFKGVSGHADLMSLSEPWTFTGLSVETGRDAVLRVAGERVYAVCPGLDAIKSITLQPWAVERTYTLPRGTEPVDIAVVDEHTAYVTGRRATHLLRLDLVSGESAEAIDLSSFADADGIPDCGAMTLHEGRLFVQIRRLNEEDFRGYVPPGYLAVIDPAVGQLIDVDPALPGAQAITLAGTYPKRPMQMHDGLRRLFLSATGGFFDTGGIEMIDVDHLRTMGLVVHESDGLTGADLGPFHILDAERGYLVFTTDLTISSHMTWFSLLGGVDGVNLHTEVDFLAPVLVFDPATDRLFFPSSGFTNPGVHVFDATTGQRLTDEVIPTDGPPTDMVLVRGATVPPAPSLLGIDLHPCVEITGSTGAVYRIEYATELPSTNWVALTNIYVREATVLWCDPSAVSGAPRRFYRAVPGA